MPFLRIVRVRQITQAFFLALFLWLCVVTTSGEQWWQLRGWPVNLFLQLDPLVALMTVVATGTLYAGLLWALLTVVLTMVLGRFFCSWVCPFGSLHHFFGFLGSIGKTRTQRVSRNQYQSAQFFKYAILSFLLGAAAGNLFTHAPAIVTGDLSAETMVVAFILVVFGFSMRELTIEGKLLSTALAAIMWFALGWILTGQHLVVASVQSGLLDPLPFLHRSINLVVLPVLDGTRNWISVAQRFTAGGWVIGALFIIALVINLWIPRFYCRFVCPLGALFAVLGSHALWRVGWKREDGCTQCKSCDARCEGACEPSEEIRIKECVLCMNCCEACTEDLIGFQTIRSKKGEIDRAGLTRRGFVCALFSGAAAVPLSRIGGIVDTQWPATVIRPPGALWEEDFLKRCIKCGQCMRICPTNVIHPAGFEAGVEGLWTPMLHFRIGTSGCQYNCAACGHVCPTAAIRPVSLDEKHGKGDFAATGPIRIGTAFVDRGRCLPWAMDKPCIVCQENCPVSPKAIFTREALVTIREGIYEVRSIEGKNVRFSGQPLKPEAVATGDYFAKFQKQGASRLVRIVRNGVNDMVLEQSFPSSKNFGKGDTMEIQVRLKRPFVSVEHCIGCGICEHECPVSGKRAIRVTAENESRDKRHPLLLG